MPISIIKFGSKMALLFSLGDIFVRHMSADSCSLLPALPTSWENEMTNTMPKCISDYEVSVCSEIVECS